MRAGRLPWYTPGELDVDQRRLYDAIVEGPRGQNQSLLDPEGRLYGPFNPMLLDPDVGQWVQGLGAALRFHTAITARGRRIAILIAARSRRSDYEWNAHERIGHTAGLTETETDAIFHERDAESFSPEEKMIATVVRELVDGGSLDDQLFAEAEAVLGTTQLGDLVILVGYYSMLASLLAVWRVPLKPDFTARFAD